MKRYIVDYLFIPILLLAAIIFDGAISVYTKNMFFTPDFIMVTQLFLTMLIMINFWIPRSHGVLLAIVFGLIYDAYYASVLSFYTVTFVAILYMIKQIEPKLEKTFLTLVLVVAFSNFLCNLLQFFVALAIGIVDMSFFGYLVNKVIPTMLLNIIYLFIVYKPFKAVFVFFNRIEDI
ncbi:rod shape-determining protein MreD [Granulicatella sp. zg-ZJ]|uniref:rod shape-determining protein MreD n=1 Tax=Granulicatella sp. zg-ZJ TaxID=2678504 RepID=UPI0013D76F9E|nr:rod shape-determining protein MreD [Granulicatella sp. zg-ZJ]NEW62804.1 rod shape-determining protein MreD [Granulicatella sp. zg-ZJ]